MRWLFLSLLVVNLLCLMLWSRQTPAPANNRVLAGHSVDEGQGIRLLGELEPDQLKSRTDTRAQDNMQDANSTCYFLGSLEREDQANTLRKRLAGLDIRAQIQVIDLPDAVDYWLYLSPFASRQAALQQMGALKKQGMEGHLIAQGELGNGISLGLFPGLEQADRLRQRLREAGYQPQLLELSRTRRSYWLRLLSQQPIDDGMLRTLSNDFARLEQRSAVCDNPGGAL